uniref:uncharacterized protein LOC120338093 n=1 Tax=Styela clava TaxID=7725 RepID=UPI001939C2AB|nr:uncharacterized protein LOC120338093 [Styela clava]
MNYHRLLLISVFYFGYFSPSISEITKTILINGGGCGVATKVPGGIVVSHDPIALDIPISNTFNCLFTIQSFRPRQTVRLVFDHLSLSPNDCAQANIEIYNDKFANDSSKLLSPTLCPGTSISSLEYLSTGNWMTLKIQANVVGTGIPKVNFSASYSAFTAKPCKFSAQETNCSTLNRCIYNELLCDGVDGCGDNTDESTDPPANCNATTTVSTPNTGATNPAPGPVDSATETTATINLTPLVAILVIAGVCLSVYVFYILMSFSWFNSLIYACLRSCLQYALRRHRDYKRKKKLPKAGNLSKIYPESVAETK